MLLSSVRGARRRLACVALAAGLAGSVVVASGSAGAQSSPYQRGPDPTESTFTATRGPFAVSQTNATGATGFGGGTIYYPTDTSQGTFGAVVIAPGFTAGQSTYAWQGPRFASHGFVVMTIDTNSRFDQPDSRGQQLQAALRYLTSSSPSAVRSRIDPTRLAVSGHSMGGGGTLAAASADPSIQAAVPQQPWHSQKSWPGVRVPTLIIGAQNDTIASTGSHSIPFYNSLSNAPEKAYVEASGASHMLAASANQPTVRYMLSWLKRFVDDDTRYNQFLCPGSRSGLSDYRNTCPIDGGGGPDPTTPPTTTPPPEECEWWEWWCD